MVHAHCPVVTVNGPGSIVGQHYDKIVLGWTEGTTGRRALEAAAEEAALRGSLSALSPFHQRLRPHRHFLPNESTLSKRSSTQSSDRERLPGPKMTSRTEVAT